MKKLSSIKKLLSFKSFQIFVLLIISSCNQQLLYLKKSQINKNSIEYFENQIEKHTHPKHNLELEEEEKIKEEMQHQEIEMDGIG